MTVITLDQNYKRYRNLGQNLKKIDSHGKIYIPKLIRDIFRGYRFWVYVEGGKIILDPIKLDDFSEVNEDEDHQS